MDPLQCVCSPLDSLCELHRASSKRLPTVEPSMSLYLLSIFGTKTNKPQFLDRLKMSGPSSSRFSSLHLHRGAARDTHFVDLIVDLRHTAGLPPILNPPLALTNSRCAGLSSLLSAPFWLPPFKALLTTNFSMHAARNPANHLGKLAVLAAAPTGWHAAQTPATTLWLAMSAAPVDVSSNVVIAVQPTLTRYRCLQRHVQLFHHRHRLHP
jgi:hypothetical protein